MIRMKSQILFAATSVDMDVLDGISTPREEQDQRIAVLRRSVTPKPQATPESLEPSESPREITASPFGKTMKRVQSYVQLTTTSVHMDVLDGIPTATEEQDQRIAVLRRSATPNPQATLESPRKITAHVSL